MISITPQGQIYLCKTPLENDYKNQLTFSNASAQRTYFNSKVIKSLDDYTYIKHDNMIKVGFNIDEIIDCNYLFYRNDGFTTKWYYCFITKMEYVNENCTAITFETDCWQTYQFNLTLKRCFVEREHVNDDTFGKHTVPENLDVGEMIINTVNFFDEFATEPFIIVGVTKLPSEIYQIVLNNSGFPTRVYNGIYNGLTYVAFRTFDDVTKFLLIMDGQGIADNVYDIFMIPKSLVVIENNEFTTTSCSGTINVGETSFPITFSIQYKIVPNSSDAKSMINATSITRNTTLNGYTPKNNKMFTGEFNYMYLSNNAGGNVKYNYEDFYDSSPNFKILGALTPGCSLKMIPANYKNYNSVNHDEYLNPYGLTGGKYPVCSWSSDSYTNWITQQSVNIGVDAMGSLASTLVTSAINPTAGVVSGITTSLGLISDSIKRDKQREYAPVQAKGNLNAGDVTYAMGMNQFVLYQMSCRYEFAKICDDYLSMFGYKVNEVKTPNITGRTYWNYVKTIDCNIEGDIPQQSLQIIRQAFNNGITFWHDASKMYDYSQTNSIVS